MENKLVFEKAIQSFGFFGYFTVLGGIIMLSGCIYYMSDFPSLWALWVLIGLSLSIIFFPILDYFSSALTIIDFAFRKIIIERKSIFGHSKKQYNFDEIAYFEATFETSSYAAFGWFILMKLKTGKEIELPNSKDKVQTVSEEMARNLNNHLLKNKV